MTAQVRPKPCRTCPYLEDAPSGVWAAHEYAKLPTYDGEIGDQVQAGAFAVFECHQGDGQVCAGWAGHRDHPSDLLALRVAASDGRVDESVFDYRTDARLFPTGAAAAAHGLADIDAPGPAACAAIDKIVRVRRARGTPVELDGEDPR